MDDDQVRALMSELRDMNGKLESIKQVAQLWAFLFFALVILGIVAGVLGALS